MIDRRDVMTGGLALSLFANRATAEARIISVPIALAPLGSPLILTTINGEGPYSFLVDSGATYNAIKDDMARTLGLKRLGAMQIQGLGGIETVDVYEAAEMVFGGALRQEKVYLHGLKNYHFTDGLVASGFLTSFNTHLDFVGKRIDVYPDSRPQFDSYSPLNAYLKGDGGSSRVMAKVTLDGMLLNLLVDTGAVATLLFPQTVKRFKLWDRFPAYRASRARGASGKVTETRVVTASQLELGGHVANNAEVSLADPDSIAGDAIDGILGINVIRQFHWAFLGRTDIRITPNDYFNQPWIRPGWPAGVPGAR